MSGLDAPQDVVEAALGAARGTETVVVVTDRYDADLRFANNTTTTNGVRRDRRVSVASVVHDAQGAHLGVAARSGAVDPARLVRAALADARAAPVAPDASPLLTGDAAAAFADAPVPTDFAVLAPLLDELGEAFGRAEGSGRLLAGFATHSVATTYLGTSTGLRRRHVQPSATLELVARAGDGSSSSWAGRAGADFSGVSLLDLESALARRLSWAARRVELPAGRYEVLLPPDAVADLVVPLAGALSGREARDGGTVFSAPGGGIRLGEQLFALPFTLSSDPVAPGLSCAPFLVAEGSSVDVSAFDAGAPLERTDWIAAGRLERLRFHRAGAREAGLAFTPPVDNLLLTLPGARDSIDELVARTERGLLLTCLWYIREVDPATLLLTGLTRDGVYLVEDGEVTAAVNNFRFNESPLEVLDKTVEAGGSLPAFSREWGEWMPRTAMPPLRVAQFNMSSVSPAS